MTSGKTVQKSGEGDARAVSVVPVSSREVSGLTRSLEWLMGLSVLSEPCLSCVWPPAARGGPPPGPPAGVRVPAFMAQPGVVGARDEREVAPHCLLVCERGWPQPGV